MGREDDVELESCFPTTHLQLSEGQRRNSNKLQTTVRHLPVYIYHMLKAICWIFEFCAHMLDIRILCAHQ